MAVFQLHRCGLAESLTNLSNCNKRQLYRYLQFYRVYPGIVDTASPQFSLPSTTHIFQSSPADNQIVGTASPHSGVSAELLLSKCTYSHLELLVAVGDSLKRAFYEVECLRGNWSVRELRRQIASLYFERSGFSKDKTLLASIAQAHAEIMEPARIIRDPYVFEFLGLRAKEAMAESDLEDALVAHLRDFLLELGHGFCLEAQQKSILIGDTRGFVDLVFYHRILKCHVLVELKIDAFRHEHLGQLNTYVEWYRRHMVSPGDNPHRSALMH